MYLTHEGTSEFNCSEEEDVPTLLIIRKQRVLIGGFMNRRSSSKTYVVTLNMMIWYSADHPYLQLRAKLNLEGRSLISSWIVKELDRKLIVIVMFSVC